MKYVRTKHNSVRVETRPPAASSRIFQNFVGSLNGGLAPLGSAPEASLPVVFDVPATVLEHDLRPVASSPLLLIVPLEWSPHRGLTIAFSLNEKGILSPIRFALHPRGGQDFTAFVQTTLQRRGGLLQALLVREPNRTYRMSLRRGTSFNVNASELVRAQGGQLYLAHHEAIRQCEIMIEKLSTKLGHTHRENSSDSITEEAEKVKHCLASLPGDSRVNPRPQALAVEYWEGSLPSPTRTWENAHRLGAILAILLFAWGGHRTLALIDRSMAPVREQESGLAALGKTNYSEALSHLSQAIQLQCKEGSRCTLLRIALAQAYEGLGQHDKERDILSIALAPGYEESVRPDPYRCEIGNVSRAIQRLRQLNGDTKK